MLRSAISTHPTLILVLGATVLCVLVLTIAFYPLLKAIWVGNPDLSVRNQSAPSRQNLILLLSCLCVLITGVTLLLYRYLASQPSAYEAWHAQTTYAPLARQLLQGKRQQPDDTFYQGLDPRIDSDALSQRTIWLINVLLQQLHSQGENDEGSIVQNSKQTQMSRSDRILM